MELLSILEKEKLMLVTNEYIKYRDIIKELLKDITDKEVINYQIESENDYNKTLTIATSDNNIKSIKYSKKHSTYENKTYSIILSDEHTKLKINYSLPFGIKLFSSNFNYYKHIDMNMLLIGAGQNKIQFNTSINSHKSSNQVNMIYNLDENDIEGAIEYISDTPTYTKYVKKKALKKKNTRI